MIVTKSKTVHATNYDPFEEDCCGHHSAEVLTIEEDRSVKCPDDKNVKIVIREYKSGIGDSFAIFISGKGQTKKIVTCVDDDGEFICEMKGCDL